MARPPLIYRRETLRLAHPADEAIDTEATPAAVLSTYIECDDLNPGALIFRRDDEPTWYEVRALTDTELLVANSMRYVGEDPDSMTKTLANAQYMLWIVSLALVSVENLEGWDESMREREHGVEFWSHEQIGALGSDIAWLFKAIMSLSTLPAAKKKHSGSSPISPCGTNDPKAEMASEGPARSTAQAGA